MKQEFVFSCGWLSLITIFVIVILVGLIVWEQYRIFKRLERYQVLVESEIKLKELHKKKEILSSRYNVLRKRFYSYNLGLGLWQLLKYTSSKGCFKDLPFKERDSLYKIAEEIRGILVNIRILDRQIEKLYGEHIDKVNILVKK